MKEEQTAAYSVEIWKRFRKWGGIPTGITQNIKDLLASREIENIFENSDFIYMLNQAAGDRQILAKQLNISPYQLSYVTNSGEGEGLLFYGNIIIPFKDRFNKNLKLYSLMTTKPEEVEKRKEEEAKAAQKEEAIRASHQQRKPFVWTPGELEDEEYWLDEDVPEEPLNEDDPGKRYIQPHRSNEDDGS